MCKRSPASSAVTSISTDNNVSSEWDNNIAIPCANHPVALMGRFVPRDAPAESRTWSRETPASQITTSLAPHAESNATSKPVLLLHVSGCTELGRPANSWLVSARSSDHEQGTEWREFATTLFILIICVEHQRHMPWSSLTSVVLPKAGPATWSCLCRRRSDVPPAAGPVASCATYNI